MKHCGHAKADERLKKAREEAMWTAVVFYVDNDAEIEAFTIECVDEFDSDELVVIFTEYLLDYARMEGIEELKITDIEIERDDVNTVSGEI